MVVQKRIFNFFLLTGILFVLFLPFLQSVFKLKKTIKPLKGAFVEVKETELNSTSWLNGDFQKGEEDYLNQNFGFRNYYVRLNNQVDYSLFNKANVDKVVVGKGGFLYESNYITSYYGQNFVGKELLEEKFKKLKDLQDLFKELKITLAVIFAPGKATFYPEFIPEEWQETKQLNNYEYSVGLCKKLDIDYVDLNAWFLKLKNITPYDLYPKTGIHWSNYGALISFDTLTRHLEKRSKLNLKNFNIANIAFSNDLIAPDDDIGIAMNLFKDVQPLPMPYAKYEWTEDSTFVKPNALFIGDSYFWNLYYEGLINNVFNEAKFWYYNQTVYPESEPQREVNKLNLIEEIKKQKIVAIMATDCNIHDFGWNFIEQAHNALKTEMRNVIRRKAYLHNITEEIFKTPAWLNDVKRKAAEKNITVEEMAKLDAVYIYETDYCRPEVIELTEETKKRIFNTPEWVEQIKAKAKEKNISFEEMLELDAKYIFVTEQRKDLDKK